MVTFLALVSCTAAVVCGLLLWRTLAAERRRSDARVAALGSAIDGPGAAPVPADLVATASLFESGRASAMQGRPLLKVAIGFAMAVAIIVLIAMTGNRQQAARSVGTGVEQAPLELLSMRHARSGESLTVTGLVRNPGEAATARLIAVVLAFDRGGDFVASGRAPLEFPLLARGDESPFQVTIPKIPDVGRYRVSFRTESGVVRHVDRRQEIDGRIAAAR
jgi:hypothetical protein